MEQFWRNLGINLGKHWKAVGAGVVVMTLILGLGASQLEFATGQDSYLNPESQVALDNVDFQDNFGGETVILLFSSTDDSSTVADLFEGANLAELERLNTELATVPEVYAVITPLTSLTFSDGLLSGGVGSGALISAAGRDGDGASARQADIGIALGRVGAAGEQVIGNPAYNELLIFGNDGFSSDSGQLTAPDDLTIRLSLASTFPNPQTAVGGIILQGNASLDEQSAGTKAVVDILDTADFEGFELVVTGSPVYLAEINDYLKGGMLTLGLAAMGVMAIVLALMFRVRWRLLPLLAVIVGVAWAFSILGLIGIDLSLVTISGLPILIGLGIDFAIQIHNRIEEEVVLDKDEHPIAETLSNVAPPLIVATIAGVLAFLALRISKVPMIRDFGVMLAVGIIVLVVVGIVIPAAVLGIREWTTPTETRGPSLVERIVVKLGGIPSRFGLPLMAISLALFIGGIFAEGKATIESDPVKWIDQSSQAVQDIERLEDETGFASTLGILVNANNVFDADVVNFIHDFTVSAEARPEVVSSSSLVNTMGKIIRIDGASVIAPTSDDIVAAAAVMPPDIALALVNPEQTSTQINLRLAQASLEERSVLVAALEADLDALIADLDISTDSILLENLGSNQDPIKATPAGLATVGIGLLENLSANRANLTYLALALAGLFLVLRFRSASRALISLVPVLLAVGVSSLIVGFAGIELSPLTTVGGPLVIASCAEFSVLILGRYLEERQRGLEPQAATDTAAARTGRAFFTSAMTTIGGFAVLIGSALPLLRDFGIIVSLNVAIALLAALVVMPPLLVWADNRGLLGTTEQVTEPLAAVQLAAPMPGRQTLGMAIGAVSMIVVAIAVFVAADTSTGEANETSFNAIALPTTTTTTIAPTTTTVPPTTVPPTTAPSTGDGGETEDPTTTTTTEPEGPLIDPAGFGEARPETLIGGVLFDLMTGQGVAPNEAVCAIETLATRVTDDELIALGVVTVEPAAVEPINQAALDCGIPQDRIDAAIDVQRQATGG